MKTQHPKASLTCCGSPYDEEISKDVYLEKAPSLESIRKAIPKHCFQRSALKSIFFVFRDVLFAGACLKLFLISENFIAAFPVGFFFHLLLQSILYVLYSIIQGTILTGLWVVGHDCGHGAFSSSTTLNDFVGFIVHSFLLVPYYSWQYSHNKHHSYTNHLVWGETHVPGHKRRMATERTMKIYKTLGDDGFAFLQIFWHLFMGWTLYLAQNETGGRCNYEGRRINKKFPRSHFNPVNNEIFPPKFRIKVLVSTIGLVVVLLLLVYLASVYGTAFVSKAYFGPYLIVNLWLVLYTWLHHTHPNIPHFGEESFSWLRGSLATVDRNYPAIINHLHHHIGSTHVMHHIEFKIPHYHVLEASNAIQPIIGKYYRKDTRPIFEALLEVARTCHYVEEVENVQYYKSCYDVTN